MCGLILGKFWFRVLYLLDSALKQHVNDKSLVASFNDKCCKINMFFLLVCVWGAVRTVLSVYHFFRKITIIVNREILRIAPEFTKLKDQLAF